MRRLGMKINNAKIIHDTILKEQSQFSIYSFLFINCNVRLIMDTDIVVDNPNSYYFNPMRSDYESKDTQNASQTF